MLALLPFTALIILLLLVKADVTYSYHEGATVVIEISVLEISLSEFTGKKKEQGGRFSGIRPIRSAAEYLIPKSDIRINALFSNKKENDYSTSAVTRLAPPLAFSGIVFGYLKAKAKSFTLSENALLIVNDKQLPETFYINFTVSSRVFHILLSLLIYHLAKRRQKGEVRNAG